MHYTVVLELQDGGGYTARCVELPGTVSTGESKDKALENLRDAIRHVQDLQRENLHEAMAAVSADIIRIEVAESA